MKGGEGTDADGVDAGRRVAEARGAPARQAEQRTALVKRDTEINQNCTQKPFDIPPFVIVIIFSWAN